MISYFPSLTFQKPIPTAGRQYRPVRCGNSDPSGGLPGLFQTQQSSAVQVALFSFEGLLQIMLHLHAVKDWSFV
jgi:hypothetical protein